MVSNRSHALAACFGFMHLSGAGGAAGGAASGLHSSSKGRRGRRGSLNGAEGELHGGFGGSSFDA